MLSTGPARFIFQFMVSKNVDTDDKFYRVLYELGRDVACDQIWVWHALPHIQTSPYSHTVVLSTNLREVSVPGEGSYRALSLLKVPTRTSIKNLCQRYAKRASRLEGLSTKIITDGQFA